MADLHCTSVKAAYRIPDIAPQDKLVIETDQALGVILVKRARSSSAGGTPLPGLPTMGRLAVDQRGTWLSQSPREWLLLAMRDRIDFHLRELTEGAGSTSAAVMDMSDAIQIIRIGGLNAVALIAKGSGIGAERLTSGMATRIRVANICVSLAVMPETQNLTLLINRQHVSYFWCWLRTSTTGLL